MKTMIVCLSVLPFFVFGQPDYRIETLDISNFWNAFDQLKEAKTKRDSIRIIQEEYIDRSSDYFKDFLKVRNFTAEEYIKVISLYPKFWNSVRPLTEAIASQKDQIDRIFKEYQAIIPGFRQPNICFAIGCLRTGGTTSKGLILIGSEIAASDASVDKSEMSGWLERVIGNSGDIVSMIAHETVHTQQFNRKRSNLLTAVLTEGIADFITLEFLNLNINQKIFQYGATHECTLWKAFEEDLKNHPKDHRRWLYQGNKVKDRPADLGYFIGYKIAKAYYEKQSDKRKAIRTLMNVKKYKKIYKKSKYWEESCN